MGGRSGEKAKRGNSNLLYAENVSYEEKKDGRTIIRQKTEFYKKKRKKRKNE